MIKIIKHGAFRKTECPMCKCLFYFTEDELSVETKIDIDSNNSNILKSYKIYMVKCPDCKFMIEVLNE